MTYDDKGMTDALAAENDNFTMKLVVAYTGETFRIVRRDGIMLVYTGETEDLCDCTLTCARLQLMALMNGNMEVIEKMKIEGDATVPARLVKYMSPINRNLNIIEP